MHVARLGSLSYALLDGGRRATEQHCVQRFGVEVVPLLPALPQVQQTQRHLHMHALPLIDRQVKRPSNREGFLGGNLVMRVCVYCVYWRVCVYACYRVL